MPPRLSLRPTRSLQSACQSFATQPRAFFSTNGPQAAARYVALNTSRELLGMDKPNNVDAGKGNELLLRVLKNTNAIGGAQKVREEATERSKEKLKRDELGTFMTRPWQAGDVYAPHDMSPNEMHKWKQNHRPTKDIIDILGINPLDHYRNFSMISEFMTEMGRVKPSRSTGLRPVNQRKMAKAIRRAVGMGIHPSTHRHPMIIYTIEDMKKFVDLKAVAARKAAEESQKEA